MKNSNGMKVLSISTDRKLFEEGSAVLERSKDYASKMEKLHIIVFSLKSHNLKFKEEGNLYIYPTNSLSRWFYVMDAVKIGKSILNKSFVISTQDPFETGLVGYKLKKKFNLPLQIQIHTDFLSPYFRNSFLNYIRVFISKFTIPKADYVRVVSSSVEDSLRKISTKVKIQILPVFVDIPRIMNFQPKKDIKKDFPQFKFSIFMASRLTKEKRIDTALKAFRKVVDVHTEAGLIISGSGKEEGNLKSLVKSLGLTKNVIFTGWNDGLISYYKTADIFLLTSQYEGYGMTLVEAGASGCPIVTTKVGLAKTDLFKNGANSFVCSVWDVNCLSESILKLISNPNLRLLFKTKMQDSIRNTTISKEEYVTKYVSLLQDLLK